MRDAEYSYESENAMRGMWMQGKKTSETSTLFMTRDRISIS
jgi:hypothetical protein